MVSGVRVEVVTESVSLSGLRTYYSSSSQIAPGFSNYRFNSEYRALSNPLNVLENRTNPDVVRGE